MTSHPHPTSRSKSRRLRAWCLLGLLALMVTPTVGCFVPIYSARPERRVEQLLYTSENMRSLLEEWERFWLIDQPSHLTPIRTHGGIF